MSAGELPGRGDWRTPSLPGPTTPVIRAELTELRRLPLLPGAESWVLAAALARGFERVPPHVVAHAPPLLHACRLIEAEVNPAEDARIVDVSRDLVECRIAQHDAGHRRMRHDDLVAMQAKCMLEHRARRTAGRGVAGAVAGMAGRFDERHIRCIRFGALVAIRPACGNRRFGAPEVIVIFRLHQSD